MVLNVFCKLIALLQVLEQMSYEGCLASTELTLYNSDIWLKVVAILEVVLHLF